MSTAQTGTFNPESWAKGYVDSHSFSDPGITSVYYFPMTPPGRMIRLLYVNSLLPERIAATEEPYIFGVDRGGPDEHEVQIVDVTPAQWERLQKGELHLPTGWSLDDAQALR